MSVWAAQLTQARIVQGLTQKELADKLGTSRDTVSKWENMRYRPDMTTWLRWSDVLEWELILLPK